MTAGVCSKYLAAMPGAEASSLKNYFARLEATPPGVVRSHYPNIMIVSEDRFC